MKSAISLHILSNQHQTIANRKLYVYLLLNLN